LPLYKRPSYDYVPYRLAKSEVILSSFIHG
jgi:hypothetical protein